MFYFEKITSILETKPDALLQIDLKLNYIGSSRDNLLMKDSKNLAHRIKLYRLWDNRQANTLV